MPNKESRKLPILPRLKGFVSSQYRKSRNISDILYNRFMLVRLLVKGSVPKHNVSVVLESLKDGTSISLKRSVECSKCGGSGLVVTGGSCSCDTSGTYYDKWDYGSCPDCCGSGKIWIPVVYLPTRYNHDDPVAGHELKKACRISSSVGAIPSVFWGDSVYDRAQ